MIVLAGTGHRPDKLGGHGEDVNRRLHAHATSELGRIKPDVVISGMALGWDQALAHAAIDIGIPVHAYIPFKGQEITWPEQSQVRYHAILRRATKTVIVCDGHYEAWKMSVRNERMVRDCTHVLALWDGSHGGTANCVTSAKRAARPVINSWIRWKNRP